MLKVGFDVSVLKTPGRFRGAGKYTTRLIGALRSARQVKVVEIENQTNFPPVDIVHYPFFDFYFLTLPFFKKKKTVVTVHDCIPLVFPKSYSVGIKGKIKLIIQKLALKGVSVVLTDSETSKKDICRFLGIPEKKVVVTYLAPDACFKKIADSGKLIRARKVLKLPEKFILYVGDVNFNKNLPGLLKGFSRMTDRNCSLVLVGKAFQNRRLKEVQELTRLVKELDLKNRVKFLGYISDDDLLKVYNLASAFCMPSFYEGFGLQVLEAMACGCPVVAGNNSSLIEVAGEAAVLVDSNAIDSIAGGLNKVINEEPFRQELIARGLKRAGEFSWEKTAAQTVKVYESVKSQDH